MGSGTVALGVIGNITALIMFFSPLPTFSMIHKQKSTGRFSAFPYVCTLMNCLLWFFYGLPIISENNILVLTINGAGIIIESIYLVVFIYYAAWPVKTHVLRSLVFVIFFCAITFAITLGAFEGNDRTTFLGSINVIINTMMYAAPLSVMKMVIQTKSVEYMPFMLSLCSFVNATLWALYGILKQDKFIIIPNGLGVLLGALQLGLYAKYRKYKTPPASLTEGIASAYTTEGATATDLSAIITRGATDLTEAISKGTTSAADAAGRTLHPPPASAAAAMPGGPTAAGRLPPHHMHAESLKIEFAGGRKDEIKPSQRLMKVPSAPEPVTSRPDYSRTISAPAPPPYHAAPAPAPAPAPPPAPAAAPAPPAPAAPASELRRVLTTKATAPPPPPEEAPQPSTATTEMTTVIAKAVEAVKEAPKTFKDAILKEAPSIPAKVHEAVSEVVPKVKEVARDVSAKIAQQVKAPEDAADVEAKARKEQEEAFARMKSQEEQKRADELRRLQEAFDEEEYGAELETIFL